MPLLMMYRVNRFTYNNIYLMMNIQIIFLRRIYKKYMNDLCKCVKKLHGFKISNM